MASVMLTDSLDGRSKRKLIHKTFGIPMVYLKYANYSYLYLKDEIEFLEQ